MIQLGLVVTPYVDYKNTGSSRRHGVLCARGSEELWDVADFHANLEERVSVERERVLRGLVYWSVCQERAAELDPIVEQHTAAVEGLRDQIKDERQTGKAVEKRLKEKQKLYALGPDALDSERKAVELLLSDVQRQVDRVPERVAGLESGIAEHQAFIDQLQGIIAELRAVGRPALPDWLQPGA